MSGINEQGEVTSDTKTTIEDEAIAWVERSDREGWTPSDQADLDAWLSRSSAHVVAFLRVESRWRRADRLAALRGTFRPSAVVKGGAVRLPARSVAGVALTIALIGSWYALSGDKPTELAYATAIGGHKSITFPDGTEAELNTDSQIRVRFDAHKRNVWIDRGEVFFQVTHNARRPFVVLVAGERITDLGTKFTVSKQSDEVRVSVVEGRAQIDVPTRPEIPGKVLLPGDVAVGTPTALGIRKRALADIHDDLAWRQGLLILNHTTLADAAAQMNRYNERKIVIADADAARQPVDGTFPTNNVELFGRVTSNILGLRVTKRANEIVISR